MFSVKRGFPFPSRGVFLLWIERTILGKHWRVYMVEPMTDFQIVLCTCANREQAERIARRLVELELEACVNIFSGVESIYRWQGAVESATECLILIKTSARLSDEVQTTIARLHSYEVPEFLVLPVAGGSESYLAWLEASLR
jgi:periplasmic divalent cation tolerance protein